MQLLRLAGVPAFDFAGIYWNYGATFARMALEHYNGSADRKKPLAANREILRAAAGFPRTASCSEGA
ncbi:hypothetical protein FK545_17425 [Planococcus glaciei]|nr:hypothetical protein FK545_17425 [Planococcus glaciei]